jgi:hypothetical protein
MIHTPGTAKLTMTHNHWHSITNHDSQPLAQYYSPLFTVVNHAVLYWFEWLWVMMCNSETVVVNHGVLCWVSGCESWWVMMNQWLRIMVCYAEPVVVNHGVLCWASDCESWCAMLRQWLWIMLSYATNLIHNDWLSITHHDSQPLAPHYSPWFTTTASA